MREQGWRVRAGKNKGRADQEQAGIDCCSSQHNLPERSLAFLFKQIILDFKA
jgi:hypothetical protein